MTQVTQEQRERVQDAATRLVARFESFVAALPEDERRILGLTIAGAPYYSDKGDGIHNDTRGFADSNMSDERLTTMKDTRETTSMAGGEPANEGQEDVAGYAVDLGRVFSTIWNDIKYTACVGGASAAAIGVNGESFGNGVTNAADFCRKEYPQ
jgi:hypothetical protein